MNCLVCDCATFVLADDPDSEVCAGCGAVRPLPDDDTTLLTWYEANHTCVFKIGGGWYIMASYKSPYRKSGPDLRTTIRQARRFRNEWLIKMKKAGEKAKA